MLTNPLAKLGHRSLSLCATLGRSSLAMWGALIGRPQPRVMLPLLIKQLYFVGVLSLAIIAVSGLFIGMVLSLQGYIVLVEFGAEDALQEDQGDPRLQQWHMAFF